MTTEKISITPAQKLLLRTMGARSWTQEKLVAAAKMLPGPGARCLYACSERGFVTASGGAFKRTETGAKAANQKG